jgi:hypothetical protein
MMLLFFCKYAARDGKTHTNTKPVKTIYYKFSALCIFVHGDPAAGWHAPARAASALTAWRTVGFTAVHGIRAFTAAAF